jgi:hypothetical protein
MQDLVLLAYFKLAVSELYCELLPVMCADILEELVNDPLFTFYFYSVCFISGVPIHLQYYLYLCVFSSMWLYLNLSEMIHHITLRGTVST